MTDKVTRDSDQPNAGTGEQDMKSYYVTMIDSRAFSTQAKREFESFEEAEAWLDRQSLELYEAGEPLVVTAVIAELFGFKAYKVYRFNNGERVVS